MFKKVLIVLSAVLVLLLISVPFPGVKYTLASEATGNLTAGMETGITGVLKSAPIASPAEGVYTSSQSVTLTAAGSIAIYYTTDGTVPTSATGTKYTTAISVDSTTTIKGIAYYGDGSSGPVASYTYTITALSGGGGGGGGGGEPPAGTTNVMGSVTMNGLFVDTVTCTTEDGLLTLTIPRRTIGLTEDLRPLTKISILPMDDPPPPPEGANIIGLTYNFEPSGATFDPPITLEYTYDPATLPEGVAEGDLVVAFYDEATGEWVECECTCDPETHCITARISHFTCFGIISYVAPPPPTPAPTAPTPPEPAPTPAPAPPTPAPTAPEPAPTPAPAAPEPTPPAPAPTAPEPAPTPVYYWYIAGVCAVAVIVAIVILVLRRKHD